MSTYHKTIKMKPIDVKSDYFGKYKEESDEKPLNISLKNFKTKKYFR